jgi:hypothetical protein
MDVDVRCGCNVVILIFMALGCVRFTEYNIVTVYHMFCTYVLLGHTAASFIQVCMSAMSHLRCELRNEVLVWTWAVFICTLASATLTVSVTSIFHQHLAPLVYDVEDMLLHFGLNLHTFWLLLTFPTAAPRCAAVFKIALCVSPVMVQILYCMLQDVQQNYAIEPAAAVVIGCTCSAVTSGMLIRYWSRATQTAGVAAQHAKALSVEKQGHESRKAHVFKLVRSLACGLFVFGLVATILLSLGYAGFARRPMLLHLFPEGEYEMNYHSQKHSEEVHAVVTIQGNKVQIVQDVRPDEERTIRRLLGGNTAASDDDGSNKTTMNRSKIVVLDAEADPPRKYFIIPPRNPNSSLNGSVNVSEEQDGGLCFYSGLDEDMENAIKGPTIQFVAKRLSANETVDSYATEEHNIDVYKSRGQDGRTNFIKINNSAGDEVTLRQTKESTGWIREVDIPCVEYQDEGDAGDDVEIDGEALANSTGLRCTAEDFAADEHEGELAGQEAAAELGEFIEDEALEMDMEDTSSGNATAVILFNASSNVSQLRELFSIDRFYGRWCGSANDGFKDGLCSPHRSGECWRKRPPIDRVDAACFYHDRCLQYHPTPRWTSPYGLCLPQGNRCMCDFKFVWQLYWAERFFCRTAACHVAGNVIPMIFQLLSCWFPLKICFWVPHFRCGCRSCSCPRFGWRRVCINLGPWCVPFGSGKVPF